MADIRLTWNQENQQADFIIANGGLVTGSDLETAVIVSLFTDARASPDFLPADGSDDPRGWWGDDPAINANNDQTGSQLWQYVRSKKAGNTELPNSIKDACIAALKWMTDDGVAATITVSAGWVTSTNIGVSIVITEPNGSVTPFNFSWAWNN